MTGGWLAVAATGGAGLLLLFIGGEGLVRGAGSLARRLGISPLVIGLTVVAFGTSAPELAVSLQATAAGSGDIALGNVIGSNIANLALILSATALVRPPLAEARIIQIDAPLMLFVSLALVWMLADGDVGRVEGAVLAAGLVGYLAWTFVLARAEGEEIQAEFAAGAPLAPAGPIASLLMLAAGIALLVAGGRLLTDAAISAAEAAGVREAVIGLTVVALGTSLPEFATSVVAAVRGYGDIAIGNVIGSNLFNVLGVLGITAMVRPVGLGDVDWTSLIVFVAFAIAVLPMLKSGMRLARREGTLLLAGYGVYLWWLIAHAASTGP